MAAVVWNDEYKMNDSVVDAHHRTLFKMISDLAAAISARKDEVFVYEALDAFARYCQFHFRAEEQMMESTGYPGLRDHRKEHDTLEEKARELVEMHKTGDLTLGSAVPQFFARWLSEHIAIEDRRMVQWVRIQGGALAGSGHWAFREASAKMPVSRAVTPKK